jgi:signal transduction histidine kinase
MMRDADDPNRAPVVLVVDDAPENLSLAAELLGDLCTVKATRSGLRALQIAQSDTPPDLILLDVTMPEMDGHEVCRRLKADAKTRDIPVIFLTAMDDVEDERLGFELGAVDYITKPISPPIFLARVRTQLAVRFSAERARRAQAVAEQANRAKTDFLSRMTHELRTPLNAVLGFSELLRTRTAERLTQGELDQLGHIHEAGAHLLALINDVLDLSRVEAGRLSVGNVEFDLNALLEAVLRMCDPLAGAAGVNIDAAFRADPGMVVRADALRLRQVMLNLMSNAIKYNRRGGSVRVAVSADQDAVRIEVIDTGRGMNAEQLLRLYKPFDRLGLEGSGIEGVGIGLTLTRQLVQLMNGDLAIQGEPERGTRASVTLPRGRSMPAAPDELALSDAPPPSGVVLYVEDNPVNALLVEQMLLPWSGVRLLHAADGASGLAQARLARPDLVLLDMHLQDMDGTQILRALRSDATTAGLNVVILSASAMQEEIDVARQCGAADYWTKPLAVERFLAGVRHWLH